MPATSPVIFGEALFDCFENGTQILGGAPFNVAWHLQALGDAPLFISRIGNDKPGNTIKAAMQDWGMTTAGLQIDEQHATGQVFVHMEQGEPHYTICENRAYDFIDASAINTPEHAALLYHGSLALRSPVSRAALQALLRERNMPVFMDINLRKPWWDLASVYSWLEHTRWCKLNQHEAADIGFSDRDSIPELARMQDRFNFEQVIFTRGDAGAVVLTTEGECFEQGAVKPERIVDSVGAGDAFSAMYIHGLLAGWTVADTLNKAQHFASAVLGQRGGIVQDRNFYKSFS